MYSSFSWSSLFNIVGSLSVVRFSELVHFLLASYHYRHHHHEYHHHPSSWASSTSAELPYCLIFPQGRSPHQDPRCSTCYCSQRPFRKTEILFQVLILEDFETGWCKDMVMDKIRSGCHTLEKDKSPAKNDFAILWCLYLRSESPCAAHGPLMNMVPGRQHYSCGQFYDNQSFGLWLL